MYRWSNIISDTRKIIWNHVKCDYTCFLIILLGTYIQCGHIWHRNKLSRCQLELLVSCSNDEPNTSLKWDSSSHPVAPECRVSHTLRLKHFTLNELSPSELCSSTINVPAVWHAGFIVMLWWSKKYPQGSNFVTKHHLIGSHHVGLLYYSLLAGSLSWYSRFFKTIFNCLFCAVLSAYLLNHSVR